MDVAWKSYNTRHIESKYLIRFLSMDNLNLFLKSGSLWFPRSDKFGDKMECVLIEDLLSKKLSVRKIEDRKKRFLISCWHSADNESLSLWDTYVDQKSDRRVCAIRFDRTELCSLVSNAVAKNKIGTQINSLVYGKIRYKNLIESKNLEREKIKYCAFRKESSFKYEDEFRFVIQLSNRFPQDGFNYNIGKANDLQFEILVNPLLTKKEYLLVKNRIKKSAFAKKVTDSKLVEWLKPGKW